MVIGTTTKTRLHGDGLSNVVNSKIYDLLPFWKGKAMTKDAKNFYCTLSDDWGHDEINFFSLAYSYSQVAYSCESSSSVVLKRKSLITDLAFFENHWWLTKRNKQEERVLVMFSVDNSNRWFFILCDSLQTAFGESLKANAAVEKLARHFFCDRYANL